MISYHVRNVLIGLVSALAVATVVSCARKPPPVPESASGTTTYPRDRAVIVHRGGDENIKQYYRDDNGKLYYVDKFGSVHVVEKTARIERGTAGLYYIIDDDNVTYSTDQSGRVYYRDNAGRTVFIEESGAGKVIDPLPILRGDSSTRVEHLRGLDFCNEAWRKCTNRCDEAQGLSSKRTCLENCDYQRDECLKPY